MEKNITSKTDLCLSEGADSIISQMRNPERLLRFCFEAINLIHQHQVKKEVYAELDDPLFDITMIIEHIIIGWMQDGKKGVFQGIAELSKMHGPVEHTRQMGLLAAVLDIYIDEHKPYAPYENLFYTGMQTLNDIGNCLYELQIIENKNL